MKLSTKLALGFLAVILVVIGLGTTGFVMFRQVEKNVTELSSHNLPAVRHATSVERSAFQTIQEEKNYLLFKTDEARTGASERLKGLMAQLDEINKLAEEYKDASLAAKSAEVGKAASEYERLYGEAVSALQANAQQERLMDEKGMAANGEADAFMDAKKAEYSDAKNALAVANSINAWALEMRFHEKSYMLTQAKQHVGTMERNVASLLKAFDVLDKLRPDETEKKQIVIARAAAQEYLKAVRAWVEEYKLDAQSTALADYSKIMNRSGDTVSQLVDDYMLPKQAAVDRIAESMLLVRDAGEAAMSARINEKAYIITRDRKYWDELNRLVQGLPAIYDSLRKMTVAEDERQRIDRASAATEQYVAAANIWVKNDTNLRENILPKMKQNGEAVIAMAQEAQHEAWTRSDQASAGTRSVVGASRVVIVGAMGIGILVGLVLAWVITRSITKPINRIIDGLTSGAGQVSSAAGHVSSASQQLAEGSSEQAAAVEETSASLEQMASMTQLNADNAGQANRFMVEMNSGVTQAGESMTRLKTSMGDISRACEETRNIIKTIDGIAFQTNLLALNAAVEAARAGESGAGFAVVADEVRSLAKRSADAARSTTGLIEQAVKSVGEGAEIVQQTASNFSRVAESSAKVGGLIGEITAASQEQALGIEQINRAVVEMDKVVQRNAANAEESAASSEELSAQAEHMKAFVGELVTVVGGKGKAGADLEKKRIEEESWESWPEKTSIAEGRKALPGAGKADGKSKGSDLRLSPGEREC
jgi:methyl-accepting chemotaxis protein